jgi:RNA polymerase sigma factor (sigma-70 family)
MTLATNYTIFVVDDDQAMRNSLQWLIESTGMPVQTFASADAFLTAYQPESCGCLLLDVRMPGMNGLELQAYLAQHHSRLPVIIITGHGDIAMAVKAMKAGAADFIEKPFDDENLLQSIHSALRHEEKQRCLHQRCKEISAHIADLTPREHQVMHLVTDGQSNREIATKLGVSAKTVEVHRARVMDKMQANSLAELVRMVILADQQTADPS